MRFYDIECRNKKNKKSYYENYFIKNYENGHRGANARHNNERINKINRQNKATFVCLIEIYANVIGETVEIIFECAVCSKIGRNFLFFLLFFPSAVTAISTFSINHFEFIRI